MSAARSPFIHQIAVTWSASWYAIAMSWFLVRRRFALIAGFYLPPLALQQFLGPN